MAYTYTPTAYQGFVAQVVVTPGGALNQFRLRATQVGLKLSQEIETPPLIDGIVDNSAYILKAQEVGGDIAFPLIHEGTTMSASLPTDKGTGCGNSYSGTMASTLWQMAASRDSNARLVYDATIHVAYPDNSRFAYNGCVVNSMKWTVNQGAPIEVTANFIGGANASTLRTDDSSGTVYNTPDFLAPSRIVTWNDFNLAIWGQSGPLYTGTSAPSLQIQDGSGIRSFDVEINNEVERYNTLNGMLQAQDVSAKKRTIKGNFKILGRSKWLNNIGTANQNRFTSDESMAFGYKLGGSGNFFWATSLHGLLFKIEEMTISPSEVFESEVGFMALGDCTFDYDATSVGTTTGLSGYLAQPTNSAQGTVSGTLNYGGQSRSGYNSTPFSGWY